MAGTTSGKRNLAVVFAFLIGASPGVIEAQQIPTANPIAARTWGYLGSQNRVRTKKIKNASALTSKSTPCNT